MTTSRVAALTFRLLLALAIALPTPGLVGAQEPAASSIYSVVKKSLAHIIVRDGKSSASGTGFCIGSHDGAAYILTNKHVVGNDSRPRVVLLSDPDSELYGRIDRLSTLDAAIIAVDNASCTPLPLITDTPTVGTEIGIAGFPAFQLALANDAFTAEPSFHAGSVSALPGSGSFIEYDAQTDKGNSGSPLFNAHTGAVIGLVTLVNTGATGALQNNLAISVGALASFISNSHANVAFDSHVPAQVSAAPLATPSGATQATVIDGKCGAGTSTNLYATLNRALAESNANDYTSAMNDDRAVIESSNQCATSFSCPSVSCDDEKYVVLLAAELLAQQNLRLALARTNGDVVNALRNELTTNVTLCSVQSILSDGYPYAPAREIMKASLKLSRVIHAVGPYQGVVDAQAVRDCASKLGV